MADKPNLIPITLEGLDDEETVTLAELQKRFFDGKLYDMVQEYLTANQKPAMTLYITLGQLMGASLGIISKDEQDARNMFVMIGDVVWEAAKAALQQKQKEAEKAPDLKHRH